MATPCQKCKGRGRIERLRDRPGLLGKLRGPERVLEQCTACDGTGAAQARSSAEAPHKNQLVGATIRESQAKAPRSVYNDASLMASGSWDHTIKLWSLPDGVLLRTLQGHDNWVSSLAFSPNGQILASGSNDSTVKLWQVSNGDLVRTLHGHGKSSVSLVSFSPDGRFVSSIGSAPDFTVKVWNVADGSLSFDISGHAYVISAAFSPDGTLLATGSNDSSIKIWSLSDGALQRSPKPALGDASYRVWKLAFSPDGHMLAARCGDRDVILIQVADGSTIRTLSCDSSFSWMLFAPDSRSLVLPGYYSISRMTLSGGQVSSMLKETDQINCSAMSPSGRVVALTTFLSQEVIRLKDLSSGETIATLKGHEKHVDCIAFSPVRESSVEPRSRSEEQPLTAGTSAELRTTAEETQPPRASVRMASSVSRCRYVMCTKCNAVHDKETTLSGWRDALGSAEQRIMFGTRTCQCGYVMQVGDIYQGLHDLPRQYWNQVQGPVEIGDDLPARSENQEDEAQYAKKCLEPRFHEEREDRKWDSSPEARAVNALLNSGKLEECARAAESKATENSDFDLFYTWGGSACIKLTDCERARRILEQGLSMAKRKSLNCNKLGECEWKARNAKDAAYWWAQAIHCRESIKDQAEESPYLYLHYVADGLGLSDVAAAFVERVDWIRPGKIRLNSETASDLRELAREQATTGLRTALTGLRDRYLKPSPPAKEDLSDPEEKLDRLLHQIEDQLQTRPNPALSMVALGLKTTALGKKIVWCHRRHYDEPCAMDTFAAANFLNRELKAIDVTVSSAGSMGGRGGEGNQLFNYQFRSAVAASATDPREISRFAEHTDIVDNAAFLSDGRRAVSSGREGSVKVWDITNRKETATVSDSDLMTGVLGLKPSANHVLLVFGVYGNRSVVRRLDVDSGKLSHVCHLNTDIVDGLHSAVFSADCQAVLGMGFKRIGLWRLDGPTLITHFDVLNPIGGSYCRAELSPDAQKILCAEGDNAIHLIDGTSGSRHINLVGHEGRVNQVRFLPSGDMALSCSDDHTARLWDLQTAKEVRCLRGHTAGVWCLDVSIDGKYAATAGSGYPEGEKDCTIRIWDVGTGSEVARLTGHSAGVRSVRFDRSGERLISASVDKTVRVWNLR